MDHNQAWNQATNCQADTKILTKDCKRLNRKWDEIFQQQSALSQIFVLNVSSCALIIARLQVSSGGAWMVVDELLYHLKTTHFQNLEIEPVLENPS